MVLTNTNTRVTIIYPNLVYWYTASSLSMILRESEKSVTITITIKHNKLEKQSISSNQGLRSPREISHQPRDYPGVLSISQIVYKITYNMHIIHI